jgi:hypothetical protein
MNNTCKHLRLLSWLGCFLAAWTIFSLSGCKTNSQETVKIKNYLNWNLEFRQDATEAEKAEAMDSVEKYILHHLPIEEYTGWRLYSVTFNTTYGIGPDREAVSIEIVFTKFGTQAAPPPKPGGGGPGRLLIPDSIPNIRHISIGSGVE